LFIACALCGIHYGQICDHDIYGFIFYGLVFRRQGETFVLGEQTNGFTDLGEGRSGFVEPAEGPYALNNGEKYGFVFTAFQVLLVKPVDGL
jgi:hypothetical protein